MEPRLAGRVGSAVILPAFFFFFKQDRHIQVSFAVKSLFCTSNKLKSREKIEINFQSLMFQNPAKPNAASLHGLPRAKEYLAVCLFFNFCLYFKKLYLKYYKIQFTY